MLCFWWLHVAHRFSFLCCVFGGSVLLIVLVFYFVVFGGSVLLIVLVFCVEVFGGSVLLKVLVFCVLFLVAPCWSSF